MKIRRILVGVDFSAGSAVAVEQAMDIARRQGAELVLVHAGEVPERATVPPHLAAPLIERYEAAVRDQYAASHRHLEQLHERLQGQGVEVSQLFVHGLPDEAVPLVADELGADLVIIGTHGRTGFQRFVMGSYAEQIARRCTRNILVARAEPTPTRGYQSILVPTDFSAAALPSLHLAIELAADDATIELFHAWSVPFTALSVDDPVAGYPGALSRDLAKDGAERGARLIAGTRAPASIDLSYSQREGSPSAAIHERLEEGSFDLVVMGGHGHRGVREWLLGSVTEQTLRHAPCSVAVVKAHAASPSS